MKITPLSTGTLRLKPTFLEGSPAHGGTLGLIRDLAREREQGFIAKVEEHRQTLPRVLSLVRTGVACLPSHDPESPARLAGSALVQTTSNVSIAGR